MSKQCHTVPRKLDNRCIRSSTQCGSYLVGKDNGRRWNTSAKQSEIASMKAELTQNLPSKVS